MTVAFFFERGEPMLSLRQLRFRRGRAHKQFRAAFFVRAYARLAAIAFDRDLVKPVAILSRFGFDRVTALRALGMLRFRLLHAFGLLANFLAQLLKLRIERHAFLVHVRELAGEHDAQLGAHFVAQIGIALGLAGLAFERVHLPRDFFKNVVYAVQIRLGVFEASFGQALLGFEFCDPGCLFNDGAAIGGTAA